VIWLMTSRIVEKLDGPSFAVVHVGNPVEDKDGEAGAETILGKLTGIGFSNARLISATRRPKVPN